jgi:hypothetical protein
VFNKQWLQKQSRKTLQPMNVQEDALDDTDETELGDEVEEDISPGIPLAG